MTVSITRQQVNTMTNRPPYFRPGTLAVTTLNQALGAIFLALPVIAILFIDSILTSDYTYQEETVFLLALVALAVTGLVLILRPSNK